ncbi:MAG: histidinol dehydrogenase [Pseudomonadota bacterium]
MVKYLRVSDSDFAAQFAEFLNLRSESEQDVAGVVKDIIADVRKNGDQAIAKYSKEFDRLENTVLRFSEAEIQAARAECSPEIIAALEHAAERIGSYHQKQLPQDLLYKDEQGVTLGWKWTAIDAVGIYVPGGKASYPSSVLMNAIAAQVAGVSRIAMVTPTQSGDVNPVVLAAADIIGITEIYRIGGVQAVAALAYGSETIAAVDKIVGPGNAYVAEAKRQVFGKVGIDMIAGPSEILVVADNKNNPAWIAADLLSQAEHDESAQSILICDDADFALRVEQEIAKILENLQRREIAAKSWQNYGAIIIVDDLSESSDIINKIAPEHLELAVENPEILEKKVRHAGAIFLGRHTPEAIGDYIAGPSHVLPTSATARFSSGLSVYDFLKRSSLISCDANSVKLIGENGSKLAASEGLPAHKLSIDLRL